MAALCSKVPTRKYARSEAKADPGDWLVAMFVFKHDRSIDQHTIDLKRREEMYSFHRDGDGLHPLFPLYLFVESGIH